MKDTRDGELPPREIHDERSFSGIQSIKCFVMMPFGAGGEYARGNKESDFVYNYVILPGVQQFESTISKQLEVVREVDKNTPGSITSSIVKNIATAEICIVDITGRNPNVFFELGIRYSLREKTTILLRQEGTAIPFDIAGYQCISYDCLDPSPAVKAIRDSLLTSFAEDQAVDSLVFETFSDLQLEIPGVVRSGFNLKNQSSTLPWREWWARISELISLLKDPFDNGRVVPTAVFGISNGGLLVADLLGREVFHRVPILSLWANRWDQKPDSGVDPACYYFDNVFNRATFQQLGVKSSEKEKGGHALLVLLLDDLVFTASTIRQAEKFIRRELKGQKIEILFAPMFCRRRDYVESIEHLLPVGFRDGKAFDIGKDEYYRSLESSYSVLPYFKDIGRG